MSGNDDIKDMIKFLKQEGVAYFKCEAFEATFSPSAFGEIQSKPELPTVSDDDLLFASSN